MADLERGLRIKELRASRHFTQEAMADLLDVTVRGYQEWEAGGGIKWDNVKKLAEVLGVDPDYLMNGPKPETPDLLGSSQLDRIEADLAELQETVDTLVSLLAGHEIAQAVESANEAPSRKPGGRARKSRAS